MLFFISLILSVKSSDFFRICPLLIYDDDLEKEIVSQEQLNFVFEYFLTVELHKFKLFVLDIKNNLLRLNTTNDNIDGVCLNTQMFLFYINSVIKIKEFRLVIINEKSKLYNIINSESSLGILNASVDGIKNFLLRFTNFLHDESNSIIPIDMTIVDPILSNEVKTTNDQLFINFTQYIDDHYNHYKEVIKEIFN